MRIPPPTRVGPNQNEIEREGLREAGFGYVQDVARIRWRE
jgi:hypothetical protein